LDRNGLFHLGVVILVGATTFLGIRLGVGPGGGSAPLEFGALRFGIAGAALLAWLLARGRGLGLARDRLAPIALSGALLWGAGNGLASYASKFAGAGLVAMSFATGPLWVLALEAIGARRMPNRWELVALVSGTIGAVLLGSTGRIETALPSLAWLALVAGPVAMAVGILLARRSASGAEPTAVTAWQMLGGAALLATGSLVLGAPVSTPTTQGWLAWAYLVVAGTIAFRSFAIAMQRLSTSWFLSHAWLNPLVAALLSVMLLAEPWSHQASLAAVFILLGVVGLIRAKTQRPTRENELAAKAARGSSVPPSGRTAA